MIQGPIKSGKTSALAIKVLDRLDVNKKHQQIGQALILCPTEVLAVATNKLVRHLGEWMEWTNLTTNEGVEVVTTPEKVLQCGLEVSQVKVVAIDEMDIMLELAVHTESLLRRFLKRFHNKLKCCVLETHFPP